MESVVTEPKKPARRVKKRRGGIIRFAVAVAAVGLLCAVKYIDAPIMLHIREAVESVFCYDVFGRDNIGDFPIIGQFFGQK